ncbi:HD domain-containing protein [Pseudotabrizicola sp. L79]|uniref:HD domain-containing protein n=1 Tax=Pseudotabrizicola sp. L79 TaxID=3118402 RepID=UPI002F953B23
MTGYTNTGLADRALAFLQAEWQGQADAAHDLGHIARVRAMARRIAQSEGPVDAEALDLACILHDLVNLPKDAPNRAAASQLSADRAGSWLAGQGWPGARVALVTHAIAAHSFSAGIMPQTIEARILQDADRMEALGAIGLARMFAVAGALGRGLFDPADPLAKARALDDKAFALDHLETKLFRLLPLMQTATGRAIAEQRAGFLRQFRDQLLAELA